MVFRRSLLSQGLKLCDVVLMGMTFMLVRCYMIVHPTSFSLLEDVLAVHISFQNAILVGAMLYAWHLIFLLCDLYESKRLTPLLDEVLDIAKATTIGTLMVGAVIFLFQVEMNFQWFLPMFWILVTLLTGLSRVCVRATSRWIRKKGRNLRSVLIVGTNVRATQFAHDIQTKPELGYRLLGFVDEPWEGMQKWPHNQFPIVTALKALPSFLRTTAVDEVFITLPIRSYYEQTSYIVEQCEKQGILVRIQCDLFSPKLAKHSMDQLETQSTFILETGGIGDQAIFLKRILDICIALPSLIMIAPLFGFVAVGIKLTSPGPVLFIQERVGWNKRPFRIIKFRTMHQDAEFQQAELEYLNEVQGAAFKITDDPRITTIGRFLRKTSLDELPQLWNVLKGDMSLVGPRPLPIRDVQSFNEDWHRRRFSVRPGLTCLWQVNGRSSLSFDKWMELDLQYIDKWSLWLDLKILCKTIPAVIKGSGAS